LAYTGISLQVGTIASPLQSWDEAYIAFQFQVWTKFTLAFAFRFCLCLHFLPPSGLDQAYLHIYKFYCSDTYLHSGLYLTYTVPRFSFGPASQLTLLPPLRFGHVDTVPQPFIFLFGLHCPNLGGRTKYTLWPALVLVLIYIKPLHCLQVWTRFMQSLAVGFSLDLP
jgi:hypothetical protein